MTTTTALSPEAKAAYNKGWASQAKTAESASANFVKTTPAPGAIATLGWFRAGYADKQAGAAKWTTNPDGATEAPESDGAPATDAAPAAVDAPAEKPAQPLAAAPHGRRGGPNAKPVVTIASLQKKITKDTPREEVAKIRAEIARKKDNYKWGWRSFESSLFKGDLSKAEAGYYKRHGDPAVNPYWHDWQDGFADHKANRPFGTPWATK